MGYCSWLFFVVSWLLAGVPAHSALIDGLVAYYPFNGNANDASGNGNNGIVYGATLTTDRFGNVNSAYSFDGVDNYIKIYDSASLSMTSAFTISSWVYTLGDFGDWTIVGKDYAYQNQLLYPNGIQNSVCFSNWTELNINQVVLNSGTWNHVLITFNGSYQRVYANSDFIQEQILNSSINDSEEPLYIGSWKGIWELFSGRIDDVRIYNRALSSSEIQQLYSEGTTQTSVVPYIGLTGSTGKEIHSLIVQT